MTTHRYERTDFCRIFLAQMRAGRLRFTHTYMNLRVHPQYLMAMQTLYLSKKHINQVLTHFV